MTTSHRGPIEPIELFESLKIVSKDVKELWRPQADALREWDQNRTMNDVLFLLNTGAGKTLIGLLAAQSIVNETQGKVLYVCATNQLIEQTNFKASEYGIDTTTYYNGTWQGDSFDKCTGPCITNYQALFNGKSIFRSMDLEAIIFDDAHTAFSIIQEQYTLSIHKATMESLWREQIGLFAPYFQQAHRQNVFSDVIRGTDPYSVLFVPTFWVHQNIGQIIEILDQARLDREKSTMFSWAHLKDKLALCAVMVDASGVHFCPPVPPIHTLSYFSNGVRRLYLSATMPKGATFYRAFGQKPDLVIRPGGRAGDCERMILPALVSDTDEEARVWIKEAISDKKALIMVPSQKIGRHWCDVAELYETDQGHDRFITFAESDSDKLVLAGRYDGIDLPDDACRVLVVDGFPSGLHPLERFFESYLNIGDITNSLVACRVTQTFGRVSRGMNDYSVVLVMSRKLLKWLIDPRNRKKLPPTISQQLDVGDSLVPFYEKMSLGELMSKCLARKEDWLEIYQAYVSQTAHQSEIDLKDYVPQDVQLERDFIKSFWNTDFSNALEYLYQLTKDDISTDKGAKAWYMHWLGYCLMLNGDNSANRYYTESAKMKVELGRPSESIPKEQDGEVPLKLSDQATRVANRLKSQYKRLSAMKRLCAETELSSAQSEELTYLVGFWLGFESSRPDNEERKGPDNLWLDKEEGIAFVFELKTDKKNTSQYNKEEIGQVHQHIKWVQDKHPEVYLNTFLVGPRQRCTDSASPPDGLWVISPEEITRIADLIVGILNDVCSTRTEEHRATALNFRFNFSGLTTKSLLESLEKVAIADLE